MIIKPYHTRDEFDEQLNFPPLYYYLTHLPIKDPPNLMMGASWNDPKYAGLPYYIERVFIFSELFFPYELNSPHFKVRDKRLIQWNSFNLFAYTDLKFPQNVYVKEGYMNKDSKTIAVFRFLKDRIELYDTLDTSLTQ